MPNIIIKNYEHVNRSFGNWDRPDGKYVKNKDHYDRLMKEGNYIPYEQALDNQKNYKMKEYVPSKKAIDIVRAAKSMKRDDGKVHFSGNLIKAMKEIGAYKEIPSYMKLPRAYQH